MAATVEERQIAKDILVALISKDGTPRSLFTDLPKEYGANPENWRFEDVWNHIVKAVSAGSEETPPAV